MCIETTQQAINPKPQFLSHTTKGPPVFACCGDKKKRGMVLVIRLLVPIFADGIGTQGLFID